MADATIFQIEDGVVAFAVVDKAAPGYLDSWQAPGGLDALTAVTSDYDANGADWRCQITSGALTASPNDNDVEVPATFCSPARTTPQPGETSYTLDVSFLQDPNLRNGLSRFLFEFDTQEAYFLLGGDGDNPPRAVGRVRLIAGTFLGEARATLTADVSMPLSRKPDIAFGDATDSEIVEGGGEVDVWATQFAAGTPGTITPTGATEPESLSELQSASPAVTASPNTAWTTGQYVQLPGTGTTVGGRVHWSGTAWASGSAS